MFTLKQCLSFASIIVHVSITPAASPQYQIKDYDETTIGLKELTHAFFEHRECQGDFTEYSFLHNGKTEPYHYYDDNDYKQFPTPNKCGVSKDAFNKALSKFKEIFVKKMQATPNCENWFKGEKVNFEANGFNNFAMNPTMQSADEENFKEIRTNKMNSTIRYVEQKEVDEKTKVCFVGDLHGSVHSLIRNLWRLVALGHLDHNLQIKTPNFMLVFLGDYVDRGRMGIEVITTLITLYLKNINNVFLIAGNHETNIQTFTDGFIEEICLKYGSLDPIPYQNRKKILLSTARITLLNNIKNNPEIGALIKVVSV